MLAILAELVICLAVGAAAAYLFTSSTGPFLIVMTLVAIGLWIVVRLVRHFTKEDAADLSLAGIMEAIFFWWT